MTRRLAAILTAALVVALATAPASADRKATRHERNAVSWVVGVPARCSVVRISTAARGWALHYSRAHGPRSCVGHLFNGYHVLHRRYGQWRDVYDDNATQDEPCSTIRPVPAKVGVDFGICAG